MSKITRFVDLDCWKAARQLTKTAYSLSKVGPMAKDFNMRNQVTSAALSSMSNIAEGFRRMSEREFIRFLEVSASSADEVGSISYAAEDQLYWSPEQAHELRALTDKVVALDLGLIRYLLKERV